VRWIVKAPVDEGVGVFTTDIVVTARGHDDESMVYELTADDLPTRPRVTNLQETR